MKSPLALLFFALLPLEPARSQGLFTIPNWQPDLTTLEGRLTMTCREVANGEALAAIPTCSQRVRADKGTFFQRGVDWPWIGSVAWNLDRLNFDENQPYGGLWPDFVYADKSRCVTGADSPVARLLAGDYCRSMVVCTMVEEFWGRFKNAGSDPRARDVMRLDTFANVDGDWRPVTTPQCLVCPVQECKNPSCGNGRVSPAPLPLVKGYVIRPPDCSTQCDPGTFLTCKSSPVECSYRVIDAGQHARGWEGVKQWVQQNAQGGSDANLIISPGVGAPVGQCYPCKLANLRMHFGTLWQTEDALFDKGFLQFYCPGMLQPPRRCSDVDSNVVARYDAATGRSGACGCRPGMYLNATFGRCMRCPPGFFCSWKGTDPPVPEECPKDQYSAGGADECLPCDMTQKCPAGQALTVCQKSGKGLYQQRNSFCTACINCQQVSGPSATYPCYRVVAVMNKIA